MRERKKDTKRKWSEKGEKQRRYFQKNKERRLEKRKKIGEKEIRRRWRERGSERERK